jgi:MoxR-like ATPase
MSKAELFEQAISVSERLRTSLSKVIRGRDETIRLVIAALLADGHVLIEDYPGSGKTTLAKTLGRLISKGTEKENEHILAFRRVQFTPDMLPGDVLGVNIFDAKSNAFHFVHGPVFAHIVLADEINRTGPKVQAAFLECMAEKQVTIDNFTHPLDPLFFVLGTQNPIDVAGTYPLPLVQLDRFLFQIPMPYVNRDTEIEILETHEDIVRESVGIEPIASREEVLRAQQSVKQVYVSQELRTTIVNIVQATRESSLIRFGASTRAALMLQQAIRSIAIGNNRDYATEDDLKFAAPFVLLHRLQFFRGAVNPIEALEQIVSPHLERLITHSLRA